MLHSTQLPTQPLAKTARLIRQINDHPPLQLLRIHLLEHICQLVQLLHPIVRLHDPPRCELHRLNRLLPCPHRAPHNLQRLRNHDTCIRAANRLHIALGDTDAHHPATEAQQIDRIVVRALVRGAHHDGVRAVTPCELLNGLGN